MLSPSYSHLIMSYDKWVDMSADEKSKHIMALMSYVPTPAALPRSDVTTTEEDIMVSDLPDNDAIIRASQQTTASNV